MDKDWDAWDSGAGGGRGRKGEIRLSWWLSDKPGLRFPGILSPLRLAQRQGHCGDLARLMLASAPFCPQCPWTAGLWCSQPSVTCPGAPARPRTRACWSCRAPCAPLTMCSSARFSAAAPATASAWTAAFGAPSRTAPFPGGPRGQPAPTPALPPKPRPHWVPPQRPAAATGWRAGRLGWDPASPS